MVSVEEKWDNWREGGSEGGNKGKQVSHFKAERKKEKGDGGMEGRTSGAGGDSCSASSSLHSGSPELNFDLHILPDSKRDNSICSVV